MAECILKGCLANNILIPGNVCVCNRTKAKNDRLVKDYGVISCSAQDLVRQCDIVMLGVKPYGIVDILDLVRDEVTPEKIIVSMAAGIKLEVMERHTPKNTKLVRVMPNIPTSVGCGLTSVTPNANVSPDEQDLVVSIFTGVGKAAVVPESAIHGVIGVCGSSPAYCFLFMEALADGGVRGGLPRQQAYEFAAQAVLGSAKMLQESNKPPGALKDMVCSPGGTTIEAVRYLERAGFRSAVIEAMIAAMDKSKEMEEAYAKN